jgi:hypothetical protein
MMPHNRQFLSVRCSGLVFATGAVWALLLAGCGTEAYEARLKDTKAMFEHQEQLNQNLLAAWGDGETGVSLRVPKLFETLPPPAKPTVDPAKEKAKEEAKAAAKKAGKPPPEEEEEDEEEIIDNRQPTFMNIELPGLHGAFRAPLKVIGPGNTTIDGEGFVYVLTNHHLYDQPDTAKEFRKHVVQVLSEGLHKTVEDSAWHDERFPTEARAKASFVKSILYRNVTVTSDDAIMGYVREFAAYQYEQGEIQVVVLFVYPKDVDPVERLTDRIPLCLETLVVNGTKLFAPITSGGGAAATPGSTSGF